MDNTNIKFWIIDLKKYIYILVEQSYFKQMMGAILDKNHNLVEKKQPNVMHNRWLVISLKIAIVIDLFHIFQTSC